MCCGPWSLRVGDDLATEQQRKQHGCLDTNKDDRFFAFFCDSCELRKAWLILCISVLFAFQLFPAIAYSICYFSYSVQLVQFSCSVVSNSLWPHGLQHARPPCPSPTPRAYWSSCPLSQWCHYNHLILYGPLLLLPSIFPSIRVFSNELAFCIRWPKYWSFSISHSNEYSGLISFQDSLVWSPYSPRDSQESSPIPQFKNINSSVLSLLYSPTLIHIWLLEIP